MPTKPRNSNSPITLRVSRRADDPQQPDAWFADDSFNLRSTRNDKLL
jgi:hypothetical protein